MPNISANQTAQLVHNITSSMYSALFNTQTADNRYGLPNVLAIAAQILPALGTAASRVWAMRPDTRQMAANRLYITLGASVVQLMLDASATLRNAEQHPPQMSLVRRLMRSGVAFALFNTALHAMVRRTEMSRADYNQMAFSDVAGLDIVVYDIVSQTFTQLAFQALTNLPLNAGLGTGVWEQDLNMQRAARQSAQALQPFAQHTEADPRDIQSLLKGWQHEEHAADFMEFLRRLSIENINSYFPDFKMQIVAWLERLNADPDLRRDTFAAALTATASCEDRITLAFNQMRALCIAADVQRGDYDKRLPELLRLGRDMYRLDALEKIARDKIKALESNRRPVAWMVDPIEVHLAYQTGLRERLTLPVDATAMRFGQISLVTEADLQQAANDILQREATEFPVFLSRDWSPWQSVLKRMAPQTHEAMQTELIQSMDEPFTSRLNARLAEDGLTGDHDAQRIMGHQVKAELAAEIMVRHTESFLQTRGLETLKKTS